MEKLTATKRLNNCGKNQKSSLNRQSMPKQKEGTAKQKSKTNVKFGEVFKLNKKQIILTLAGFVLLTALVVVVFFNNKFYNFINRPKILSTSLPIVIMLFYIGVLCTTNSFLNIFCTNLNCNSKTCNNNCKNNSRAHKLAKYKKGSIKFKSASRHIKNLKLLKFKKTKRTIKYAYKKRKKQHGTLKCANLNIYALVCAIAICLGFAVKALWCCVIFSFAICIVSVLMLAKHSKNKNNVQNKAIVLMLLLANICIFLSFYTLFLLN